MMIDADGFQRVDLIWTIEGKSGTKSGRLYELHEQEEANAREGIKRLARRGDTVTIQAV